MQNKPNSDLDHPGAGNKTAGSDTEQQTARRVEETLSDPGRTITGGDPQARATLERLKTMQSAEAN